MAKSGKSGKKRTFPGSIYRPKNTNRLYIEFKGKRTATGLQDTPEGRRMANILLEKMFLEYNGVGETRGNITFKEAWELYEKTLINKSLKTVEGYSYSFKKIVTDKYKVLDENEIEAFILNYIRTTKDTKASINTILNQFQIFLNYCTEKKWLNKTNFKSKYSYNLGELDIKSYTDQEVFSLARYFYSDRPELSCLILFMVSTGARVVDALTLTWEDIKFDERAIVWRNKKTKIKEERPAGEFAFKLLTRLKIMNKSKVFSWSYNSKSSLNRDLNKAMDHLRIEKDGRAFQEFRVTFRMRLERKGMPEHYIEYLLRHSTGKLIYNHYTDKKKIADKIYEFLNEKLK